MGKLKVGDVTLDGQHIKYRGTAYPVGGASATVETDGEVVARFTATRIVFLGVFALAFKKKKDKRGLFLMVDGPDYAFVAELDPKKDATGARQMAMAITQAGKRYAPAATFGALTATAAPSGAIPAAWYPNPTGDGQRYWDGTKWTEHYAP